MGGVDATVDGADLRCAGQCGEEGFTAALVTHAVEFSVEGKQIAVGPLFGQGLAYLTVEHLSLVIDQRQSGGDVLTLQGILL